MVKETGVAKATKIMLWRWFRDDRGKMGKHNA